MVELPNELSDGKQESVLVVEDNEDLNTAICEILETYDYQVWAAYDGHQALSWLEQSRPYVTL
ncbi:hypothetical protein KFU94_37790 [Chloroflexi bacterium TSY]|nr:hypothetical protein [Chloroflexi bacterium TSY]